MPCTASNGAALNIPIFLTIARALIVLPVLLLYYLDVRVYGISLAMVLLVAGGISDWLDGWLARRWRETSDLGAFLDQVADKILIVSALMLVVSSRNDDWQITLPAILLVMREIGIAGVREWATLKGDYDSIKVRQLGKVKTVLQFTCIAIFLQKFEHPSGDALALVLLWAALLFSLVSGWFYIRSWLRHLRSD